MVDDRSDTIGPIKSAAAAAIVVLEVVIELEGLAILHGQNTVEAPAVLQTLPVAAHLRELISEVPGKTLRNIEVRRSVFHLRLGAVIGLSGIGFEIFTVA